MKYINRYESPVGMIILESDGKNLTGLRFEIQSRVCDVTHGVECAVKELSVFEQTERWLDIYFSGRDPGFTPPLKVAGSNFQRMICDIMLTIPYGNTTTYGRIANRVKEKTEKTAMSAQAVGGAVGHNPISVIIPCHRVVGTDGSLTGYGGGMDRKVYLLENEGIDLKKSGLFIPAGGTEL